MSRCGQCNQELHGMYCSHCGQQHLGKSISLTGIIKDYFENLFNLESPLFRNIKALLFRPATVINGYIRGERGYYFSPGKLLFFALLFVGLFLSIFKSPNRIFGLNLSVPGMAPQFIFILLLLPLFSLFSWLTYSRLKRPYVHHLVSASYAISLWTILMVAIEALIRLAGWLLVPVEIGILFAFLFMSAYTNAAMLSHKRSRLIWIGNAVLQLVITFVIFYGLLYVLKAIFPRYIHL